MRGRVAQPPQEGLSLDAVEAARAARDARIQAAGSIANILGESTIELAQQIRDLARHPRQLNQLGQGIIRVHETRSRGRIALAPLLAVEVRRGHGGRTFEGYAFSTGRSPHPSQTRLKVQRCTTGEPQGSLSFTGSYLTDYTIDVYHPEGRSERVDVGNKHFFDHQTQATYEPGKAYRAFLGRCGITDDTYGLPDEFKEEGGRLAAAMERGPGGWDYPAELYVEPLGLIRGALEELSPTSRR